MTQAALGSDCRIDDGVIVGYEYADDVEPASIGANATIRSGTIIYADVEVGEGFVTGHNVLVRENTNIGDGTVVGTNTVIDGAARLGSHVLLQTGAYVPPETELGDRVFLGPHTVLTNDPVPAREAVPLAGPTLESDVSVGANATILPDVTIGAEAFVAAGAVVTEDVPPETLAIGAPARHQPLPERLTGGNHLP